MKKFLMSGAALALTLLLLVGLVPARPAMAATSFTAPPVKYQLDNMGSGDLTSSGGSAPSSIKKGMSFGVTFGFDASGEEPQASNGIVVNLSADGLALGQTRFDFPSANSMYGETIYLPESKLRYVGSNYAVIRFSITYRGVTVDGTTRDVTLNTQKTIVECEAVTTTPPDENAPVRDLVLDSYKINGTSLKEGSKFTLDLVVKNIGTKAQSNVYVTLGGAGLGGAGVAVDGQTNNKVLDKLEPGASVTVSFPMVCAPKLETANLAMEVTLISEESKENAPSTFFIPVKGSTTASGGTETSKPQIIVEGYDYGGEAVIGGKEFPLTMNFRNTSPSVAIKNLKMTISTGTTTDSVNAFTPANASNTFFIANVGANSSFQWKIDLLPKADADPKPYGMTVTYTYEAMIDGKLVSDLSGSETIAIPLTQPDRFEVQDAEFYGSNPMFMGESTTLNINYVNKGKSKIFNLSVILEGDSFTSSEGKNVYVGNVDSGSGDSFQATLSPSAVGAMSGKAVFTYEDAAGNSKEVVKEFTCDVMDMPMDPGGMDPGKYPGGFEPMPEQPTGFPQWALYSIIGIAVVGGIIILVAGVKKHKVKKMRMLEAEDDYEDTDAPGV